jgi:hypothetical protein
VPELPLTATLRLHQYDNPAWLYVLQLPSGAFERRRTLSRDLGENACGFAQERRLGLRRRQPTLLALFQRQDQVWLWLQGRSYRVGDPKLQVNKWNPAPFVRRFVLELEGQAALDFRYWWLSAEDDEDDEDLLSHAIGLVKGGAGRIRRFVHMWKAVEAGRRIDTKEFRQELDAQERNT